MMTHKKNHIRQLLTERDGVGISASAPLGEISVPDGGVVGQLVSVDTYYLPSILGIYVI